MEELGVSLVDAGRVETVVRRGVEGILRAFVVCLEYGELVPSPGLVFNGMKQLKGAAVPCNEHVHHRMLFCRVCDGTVVGASACR